MQKRTLTKQDLEDNPDLVDFGLEIGDNILLHQEEFGLEVTIDKEVHYVHHLYE